MNAPDRFELFLLGEGEKKVTVTPDTRTPNTSLFIFNKEDHTLGNLLKCHLNKNQHVTFAGYRVPHPLIPSFELRVQTDGVLSPTDAVVATSKAIVSDLGHLSREFTKEYELRKMVDGEAVNATGNPAADK